MSTVRFATLCDKCKRRSEEYTSWPRCTECGDDICSNCDCPLARSEDERHETLCTDCGTIPSMTDYAKPYSIHGTPAEQDAYRARVQALNKGRGQTCPNCDATNSECIGSNRWALLYRCDNCGREFYG